MPLKSRWLPEKTEPILFYNTMWGSPLSLPEADIPATYFLTSDRRLFKKSAAVVFHIPEFHPRIWKRKPKNQIWVAWSMECDAHYSYMQNPRYMNRFDLKMTSRLDSDIVFPYFEYHFKTLMRSPVRKKQ